MPTSPVIAYFHVYFNREGGGSVSTFVDAQAALDSYKIEVENAYDTSESAFYTLHADGSNTCVASGGQFGPSSPAEAVEAVRSALNL